MADKLKDARVRLQHFIDLACFYSAQAAYWHGVKMADPSLASYVIQHEEHHRAELLRADRRLSRAITAFAKASRATQ